MVSFPRLRRPGSGHDGRPGKLSPLVASAQRLTLADLNRAGRRKKSRQALQQQAWFYYEQSGLLRTGVRWKANSLSRATLFIAKGGTDVPEPERVESGPSVDLLDQLFDGPGGQAQMLGSFGYQLGVPGDSYLIGYHDPDSDDPRRVRWVVASTQELVPQNDAWILDRGDGRKIKITDDDWVMRVWKSHPQRWYWADSPVMGLLVDLKELEACAQHVIASIDSRLAGAGLLLLPQEMSFPQPTEPDKYADAFTGALYESMVIPLQNRDSASAVVPIVVRVPGEFIKDCKHISFATPLDERIPKMREDGIHRIALGLDMPPEVLLGMSDANHWGAWQITEEGVKLHVEPELATICDALTTEYLWPQTGNTDETIWFDTTELTERPNRGPDAATVYEAGELSGEALRRHHGFADTEKPDDPERRSRILLRLAETNPDLALPILEHLGVITPGSIAPAPSTTPPPTPIESTRVDRDTDDTGPPGTENDDAPGAATLVASAAAPPAPAVDRACFAACNVAVMRALENAGKKLLTRGKWGELGDVPAWELHARIPSSPEQHQYLMAGAWSTFEAGAPEYRDLVPVLDDYVRGLITAGTPHQPFMLDECLAAALRARAADDAS